MSVGDSAGEELSPDAEDLIARVAASDRPVVFLLGSALTMQPGPGEPGVPDVRGVVEILREELAGQRAAKFEEAVTLAKASGSGRDFASAYGEGFAVLLRRGGQDAVNRVIRHAVLAAHGVLSDEVRGRVLQSHPNVHSEACQELLNVLDGWRPLRASVTALGEILRKDTKKFGRVLTTNFDPLIEVAVRRAGGPVHRTVLARDGHPGQHGGTGTHVVYVHGYWFDADTLHTDVQLKRERPQLVATLRRWIEHSLLVVLGYGGWDDVLMKSLQAVAADEGAYPDIAWGFYGTKDFTVVRKLEAAGERAQFYEGVDMHRLLPRLRERLDARPGPGPVCPVPGAGPPSSSSTPGVAGDAHRSSQTSAPPVPATPTPLLDTRTTLTRALLTEPNAIVRCLDDCLPGTASKPGESARDTAVRVAAKIDALGEGTGAAKTLVEACYQALSDVIEKHPGDRRGAKLVLQAVLAEWLPNRYGSALAPTGRPRAPGIDGCEDLELPTPNPEIAEIAIAFAEGRRVAYETKAPVGRARPLVEPRGSISLPPGGAEMLTYDEMVDHIANTIAEQIPARARDSLEGRRRRASGRLAFLRKSGAERDPKYIALSAGDRRDRLPDPVAARLKAIYPALGFHALGTHDDEDEDYILDCVLTIFLEDDERAPGGSR